MKDALIILLFVTALISCGNNKSGNANTQSPADSSSTLDISRKSGNNTGVQDSALNKTDSMKGKSDVMK
jgi:hypothetical protein